MRREVVRDRARSASSSARCVVEPGVELGPLAARRAAERGRGVEHPLAVLPWRRERARSSRSSAPTRSSTARSALSAAARFWCGARQVAKRSVHPSITSSWGPTSVGDDLALEPVVADVDHRRRAPRRPAGPRHRTRAATWSWPSRKTSALTTGRARRPTPWPGDRWAFGAGRRGSRCDPLLGRWEARPWCLPPWPPRHTPA